ncbi:Gfo/Idh/MocA family protein [Butyrivibrio sp. YAB3001]|uniref:Gfo/Idh/MocA family protein n=1 Tax=Butyrivibrio sp. YAB3001 TaxID=1520812 RepID=UPI0008F65386|nr:Gfo/Idh/MocA family oxidoreductase [Butyrivibrio sp. YAB3001]SFB83631.1 Predicted dehydrogenase [Butyrivibrio sp. YAB3001]
MFGRTRVAIMGTGRIAGIMADTLKGTKGVVCYAVGSRTKENADKFASQYGVKKAYGSYAELVSDPKVDLVYVATPHSEHFENVKLALSAGKPVICEKAFMLSEKQAEQVFKIAEEKSVLVTEAIWTRYMPSRSKLNELLASNVIGEPTMLTANLGYNVSAKERINKPELGGGALLDLGVYALNFASMVFGNDVTDIVSMCTYNNLGVDMQDSITLRYRNGRMAVLNATALANSDRQGVIYGTKGYIVVDNINNIGEIVVYDNTHKKIASYKSPRQNTGYEYEILACVKALSEGWIECPEMPHSETLKMLNMMDFIRKSNGIKFPGDEDSPVCEYEGTSAHNENSYQLHDEIQLTAEPVQEAPEETTEEATPIDAGIALEFGTDQAEADSASESGDEKVEQSASNLQGSEE